MNAPTKILVIEDSETLRDLVLQILRIENYEVLVAVDGVEGLRLAQTSEPDLVLCDIAMPRMSGHEVLRTLRGDPVTAQIPFIFLTAKAERSDLRVGMDLGADDYLTKPFDADELLATVRTRLRKLEAARTSTQQATEAKQSELLLNLPHEVRTPLSGILGLAELLIETDFSPEERRSMVNDILASGRRLERTLTNLMLHMELELARHSSERARGFIGKAPFLVEEAVRAAVAAKISEHGRPIIVNFSADQLQTKMEPGFLQKAVEEILDNALRFSASDRPVQVTTFKAEGEVVVEVVDSGVGMSPEQISRLQAFRQFDRAERNQQGLGLGISIAQHLAELNQGRVTFAARPEGGLTVALNLPLVK